jgi:uncharacterized membrane protein YesL
MKNPMYQFIERINPFFEWIMKFAFTNLLWLLFNLPIAYLAFSLFGAAEMPQIIMLFITICVIAPFTFFPATTAMFGVVRKWVMKEDESVVRNYWKYYKENFKRSMAGGLVFTLLTVILAVDFYYFQTRIPLVSYLFLFLLIAMFLVMLYFFSDTIHTDTKLVQSMKKALILSMANPFFSFGIAIISLGILYISIY